MCFSNSLSTSRQQCYTHSCHMSLCVAGTSPPKHETHHGASFLPAAPLGHCLQTAGRGQLMLNETICLTQQIGLQDEQSRSPGHEHVRAVSALSNCRAAWLLWAAGSLHVKRLTAQRATALPAYVLMRRRCMLCIARRLARGAQQRRMPMNMLATCCETRHAPCEKLLCLAVRRACPCGSTHLLLGAHETSQHHQTRHMQ